jgi:hypothetical protein
MSRHFGNQKRGGNGIFILGNEGKILSVWATP